MFISAISLILLSVGLLIQFILREVEILSPKAAVEGDENDPFYLADEREVFHDFSWCLITIGFIGSVLYLNYSYEIIVSILNSLFSFIGHNLDVFSNSVEKKIIGGQ